MLRFLSRKAAVFLLCLCLAAMVKVYAGRDMSSPESGLMPVAASRTVAISLNGNPITAVVADTDFTRARGLLGWDRIEEGQGMLLDFIAPNIYAIHMQGMRFPIDAVWIDTAGVVKLVYEDIQPDSGHIYPSMFPCRYCLEIKAGSCKKYGIKAGQNVTFGSPANSTQ